MTAQEAEEIRETYTQALIGLFNFTDDLVKYTSGGHMQPNIWNTVDDGDINLIVEFRLEEAQHSAKAAAGVRKTIARYKKALISIIVIPRTWQTFEWYEQHGFDMPIKFRKRRKLRVVNATKVANDETA